jgi:hypothetical protein
MKNETNGMKEGGMKKRDKTLPGERKGRKLWNRKKGSNEVGQWILAFW